MASSEGFTDKNTVFRKLKAKSENKVRSLPVSRNFQFRDVFRLQCEESNMGVGYVWRLHMHRLLRCSSQPRSAYQLREATDFVLGVLCFD
ncbi:hypothetical protein Ahy_A01g004093 isoform B [Arachis hypogaea]|uniref:Uncharacterized protein n=1 Tax=Arachis hypogaea TaxID=3818 RepID=A0A445EUT4_ARAHY|nr:hypothetical protein Ahy_A01g004093 isoform B [Arachis hypogaea]